MNNQKSLRKIQVQTKILYKIKILFKIINIFTNNSKIYSMKYHNLSNHKKSQNNNLDKIIIKINSLL